MSTSDIDICNLALTHLGDISTVASISAPTTAQERYCARFYPIARDLTLELHLWGFASMRAALVASATVPPSSWAYAYDPPAGVINYISVLDPNAADDYTSPMAFSLPGPYATPVVNVAAYTPQPYVIEDVGAGVEVIYTNISPAVLRYTQQVTDTTKYPQTFVMALSYRLAAMLAGPILKTDVGMKVAGQMQQMAEMWQQKAEGSDANQRNVKPVVGPAWITQRG